MAKHVEAVTMAHYPLALRILLAGVHGQAAFDSAKSTATPTAMSNFIGGQNDEHIITDKVVGQQWEA